MKSLIVLLALLLLPSIASAQLTGPVTTTSKLIWTAPSNAGSVATAQALEYRFRDNGGAFLAVPGASCASLAADGCQTTLSAAMVATLNAIGTHNVTLSAYDTTGLLESAPSIPFVLKSPPGAPTGVKLTP